MLEQPLAHVGDDAGGEPRVPALVPDRDDRGEDASDREHAEDLVKRLKILLALAQDGELHVSALCELLGQQQPAVSHHLTLLRMAGLVGYRRDGKHNYYRLESGLVRDLLEQFVNEASANGHRMPQVDDLYMTFKRK